MNAYQVDTSTGLLKFNALDSDIAPSIANELNTIGFGNTERVTLLQLFDGKPKSISKFELEGSQDLISEIFFSKDQENCFRVIEVISDDDSYPRKYRCEEVSSGKVIKKSHAGIIQLMNAA